MSSGKILLVDDSHDQLQTMSKMLEGANHEIFIADTTQSALEIARFSKPDVIIIDVNLAHEDGVQLCRDLRNEKLIGRPFIFLISSITKDENSKVSGLDSGADDYIHRPLPKREFVAKVDAGLRIVFQNKKLLSEVQTQTNLWDILEKSHVVIFIWKNSDRLPVEFVSDNITRFGYSTTEFISGNLNYDDIIVKEDLQKVIHNFDENLKRGVNEFKDSYRIVTKDGKIRWVEDYTHVYKMSDAVITHLQGIIIDITDIRTAQELHRESEIRYHNLLETMNDGLLHVDNNDKIIFANRKFLELSGYQSGEIANKIASELFVFPEDIDFMSKKISERIKGASDTYQTRLRKKDGTSVWISVSAAPFRNQKGKVIGSASIISDITQKKLDEDQLNFHSTILQNVHDSILSFDLDGKINYWNKGAEILFGYACREVIGKNVFNVFDQKEYKNLESFSFNTEFEFHRKKSDGASIITNTKLTHLKNNRDEIIGFIEVSKNMTDEIAIRNEKSLLQNLIAAINSAKNIEEAFTTVVKNLCDFAKWSIGEVWIPNEEKNGFILAASYSADKKFDVVIENIRSRMLKMNRGLVGEVWNSGKPILIEDMSKQNLFEHSSVLHNAGISCALGIPITTENISVAALEFFCEGKNAFSENMRSIVASIATQLGAALKRKETEAAHLHAVEKFKKIFDNSTEGIFQFDTNYDPIIFNNAFLKHLGFSSATDFLENFNGKMNDLFTDQEQFQHIVKTAVERKSVTNFETELKRKDGSTFLASINLSCIISEKKNKTFFEGTINDITTIQLAKIELQRAKERAEELSKLKQQFLANMSHELRTPMIGVLGYIEILLDEVKEPRILEMLDTIYSSSQRLVETMNSILELSRLEANKEEINYRLVDVCRVIKSCCNLYKINAEKKNLELTYTIHEEDFIVEIDERLLTQILNNLVNNAIKFTKQGSINVELKYSDSQKNWFEVNVSDTGIGIAKENFSQIFEEFRQASEGMTRAFEGSGLGLSIAKKVATLLKGKIFVRSTLGEGSIFTVTFPVRNI